VQDTNSVLSDTGITELCALDLCVKAVAAGVYSVTFSDLALVVNVC